MKVERIVKKNSRDVLIQFDNSELLILALEIFLKSGLKKNDEISENRFLLLISENRKYHIKQRAFRLLGRRHHSILEIKQKLLQKDYKPELIKDVLSELISGDYLDDKKFAAVFVEEKLRTKSWGERKLKSELIKKGIGIKIIAEVLSAQLSESDKFTKAESLAVKKLNTLQIRGYDSEKLKQKLFSFLFSKGYDYENVNRVVKKLLKGKDYDA